MFGDEIPQVSLYLDKPLYKEVESIVKKRGVSMSSFVSGVLKEYIENGWPEGYFDLFGSIDDETFDVPEEIPWSFDSKRESL